MQGVVELSDLGAHGPQHGPQPAETGLECLAQVRQGVHGIHLAAVEDGLGEAPHHQGEQAHEGHGEAQLGDRLVQDLQTRGQPGQLRARGPGELGDALSEHLRLGLGAVAGVVGDQLTDAPHPHLHRPDRAVGGLHGGDEAQVLVELEDQGVGVLLHGCHRVEDPGHSAQALGSGRRDAHPGADQGGHLARQSRQGHVVQGGEAQGRQLRGQLATAELTELVARGAPGLEVALLGAHPTVGLLDLVPGLGVHRLDPHREIPLTQRHDRGEDPVVQTVHRTVGDIAASRAL